MDESRLERVRTSVELVLPFGLSSPPTFVTSFSLWTDVTLFSVLSSISLGVSPYLFEVFYCSVSFPSIFSSALFSLSRQSS